MKNFPRSLTLSHLALWIVADVSANAAVASLIDESEEEDDKGTSNLYCGTALCTLYSQLLPNLGPVSRSLSR